jgi:hypothetical protein
MSIGVEISGVGDGFGRSRDLLTKIVKLPVRELNREIYASSDRYDASKTLAIDRLTGGTLKIVEHNLAVMPAGPENGILLGLQRSTREVSSDNQQLFRDLWRDARPNALWRQR